MHDAAVVRSHQTMRNLQRVFDRATQGEMFAQQSLAQSLAVQKLGNEIGEALVTANVEDCEDIGVIQLAGGTRFLLEAP